MGYIVKTADMSYGPYTTREEAYELVVALCGLDQPQFLYTTQAGVDLYSAPDGSLISLIPERV